ncbi:hypothetical protein MTP99_003070 [Tenebrio molitor]|jgi:hypothetical protein|uniref:Myb/SANT-like DNA-binding domain-containing protein n=2 Tax=Tenebrio molitor TaxID=7067 RepID=A0A8J6HEU7_TENMO|nr:hypothetical protein GEV33_009505 [Tenebrio molitor]KAJ3616483.1 hypothetical protein MTP99_003070 [Tenebrio molitor]
MEATQLFLNDQLVTITAEPPTIKRMNEDDQFLAEYINRAAKMGQFNFLFSKDPTLRRIVVKRAPVSFTPVWCKKGRPSETDTAATTLLLKLRNSEKYAARFKDGYSLRNKLWDEIANEMRIVGYDVDGPKCAQKFLNLTQNYQKYKQTVDSCICHDSTPEFFTEMRKIFGEKTNEAASDDDDDEEWLPKNKKKKKSLEEDDGDFLKKYLRKNSEQKDERFRELSSLIKRRNELLEEKLKQNKEIILLLGRFVKV